jgi:hypothetical protein
VGVREDELPAPDRRGPGIPEAGADVAAVPEPGEVARVQECAYSPRAVAGIEELFGAVLDARQQPVGHLDADHVAAVIHGRQVKIP